MAFWIVGRDIAGENEGTVNLLARHSKGVNDPLRVFPFIEARHLDHQRQIGRNVIVQEPFVDLLTQHIFVGRRERIDGWQDEALRHAEFLCVFRDRKNSHVVAFNDRGQVRPQISIRG